MGVALAEPEGQGRPGAVEGLNLFVDAQRHCVFRRVGVQSDEHLLDEERIGVLRK